MQLQCATESTASGPHLLYSCCGKTGGVVERHVNGQMNGSMRCICCHAYPCFAYVQQCCPSCPTQHTDILCMHDDITARGQESAESANSAPRPRAAPGAHAAWPATSAPGSSQPSVPTGLVRLCAVRPGLFACIGPFAALALIGPFAALALRADSAALCAGPCVA